MTHGKDLFCQMPVLSPLSPYAPPKLRSILNFSTYSLSFDNYTLIIPQAQTSLMSLFILSESNQAWELSVLKLNS